MAQFEHRNSQFSALHQPRLANGARVSGDFENESRDQKTHDAVRRIERAAEDAQVGVRLQLIE
jgi:hypothetical protein